MRNILLEDAFNEICNFIDSSTPLEQFLSVMAIQLSGTELFPDECDVDSDEFKEIEPELVEIFNNHINSLTEKPVKVNTAPKKEPKPKKVNFEKTPVEKPEKVKVEKPKKEPKPKKQEVEGEVKLKMQGFANRGLKYGVRKKFEFIEDNGEVFKLGERVLIETKEGLEEVTIRHIQVIGYDPQGNEKIMYDLFRDPGKPTPTAGRMFGKIKKIK